MEQDERHTIYQEGFKSGQKHALPSPATKQFMAEIKSEIKFIKERLAQMPTKAEMDLANAKLIEQVFEKGDERYASKLTEKIVYGLVGMGLLAVVGAIFRMVVK